ncbi:hypothetical protein Moror_8527 [Moniliophthora roreri MCA 2997]|uniref:Uncharacterized protein n=1 Tax=Moniliophthora roreri (strain MCA 2997) TaxID=1381753 RepID=V2W6P2_MONRO|nr:hypothetical protein Moror_8527 [Moniliophthora roreri MCA 2997]
MDTDQVSVHSNVTAELKNLLESSQPSSQPSLPERTPTPTPACVITLSPSIKRKNKITDEEYDEICRQRTRNHLRVLQEQEHVRSQITILSGSPSAKAKAQSKLRILDNLISNRDESEVSNGGFGYDADRSSSVAGSDEGSILSPNNPAEAPATLIFTVLDGNHLLRDGKVYLVELESEVAQQQEQVLHLSAEVARLTEICESW